MDDPRYPTKTRKRNWVKAGQELQQEPEHVVGRDMSTNLKQTTPASSVQKISPSAENVQNINTGNEKAMEQEVSERLTAMQTIFESGHRENNIRLDKIYNYLSRDSQSKDVTILKLKEIEKNYYYLRDEKQKLEKENHCLIDKVHAYKLLSIVATVLFLLNSVISFILA